MKRYMTLLAGTALAAALALGAQATNPPADNSSKPAATVKKHKKHVKKSTAPASTTNPAPASSSSSAPAKN
jgi:hypothetical protein